jgi:hypothetical protein
MAHRAGIAHSRTVICDSSMTLFAKIELLQT